MWFFSSFFFILSSFFSNTCCLVHGCSRMTCGGPNRVWYPRRGVFFSPHRVCVDRVAGKIGMLRLCAVRVCVYVSLRVTYRECVSLYCVSGVGARCVVQTSASAPCIRYIYLWRARVFLRICLCVCVCVYLCVRAFTYVRVRLVVCGW